MTATAPHPATAAAPDAPRPRLGRRFGALLATTGAANLGDGVVVVGVPLVAVGLTRSPERIALLTAAAWLPWLLLGVTAGVLVDRLDRRHVQLAGLTARAVLLTAGAWLAGAGTLTLTALTVLVLAYGATEVVVDLGSAALVPDLVEPGLLPTANGRVVAVQQVTNAFLGAPLAGALLTLGAGWVLGVPAALALAAAVTLRLGVTGRYRPTPPADGTGGGAARAWADVREGLRFVTRHRLLRPVVLTGAVLNAASAGYFAVLVLWAVGPGSAVGMTGRTYPLVMLGVAGGAVLGSVVAGPLVRRVGEVRLLVTCWALGFGALALPVALPHVTTLVAALVAAGGFTTVGNVVGETVRQRLVPARLRGRVTGASRTLGYGLMPLGALTAGVLAERVGLAPVLAGAVVLSLGAVAAAAATVRQHALDGALAAAAA